MSNEGTFPLQKQKGRLELAKELKMCKHALWFQLAQIKKKMQKVEGREELGSRILETMEAIYIYIYIYQVLSAFYREDPDRVTARVDSKQILGKHFAMQAQIQSLPEEMKSHKSEPASKATSGYYCNKVHLGQLS